MLDIYIVSVCILFFIVTVPTTASAIELIKCRKLLEKANELLEAISRKSQ